MVGCLNLDLLDLSGNCRIHLIAVPVDVGLLRDPATGGRCRVKNQENPLIMEIRVQTNNAAYNLINPQNPILLRWATEDAVNPPPTLAASYGGRGSSDNQL